MDPNVVAALITTVPALLVAIVTLLEYRKRKKTEATAAVLQDKLDRLVDHLETFGQKQMAVLEDKYGLRIGTLRSASTVLPDGSAILIREWHNVVTTRDVTFDKISGYDWFAAEDSAHFTSPPRLVPPIDHARGLHLRFLRQTSNECHFVVEVPGGLKKGDLPLTYSIESRIAGAYQTTKEETLRLFGRNLFPYEYHCVDVVFPMQLLILEVTFPRDWRVTAFPCAFFGRSELPSSRELARISNWFQQKDNTARLSIEVPLHAFRYAIAWIPPEASFAR